MKAPIKVRRARKALGGYSALETVMSLALLAMSGGALLLATTTGERAITSGSAQLDLEVRAHRALSIITKELSYASRSSLVGLPPAPVAVSQLDLQTVTAVDLTDGSVTWEVIQIVLEPSLGDPEDGIDNDGDGLIDECRVVLVQRPGQADERRRVLCNGVPELLEGETMDGIDENGNGLIDESGLTISRDGNQVTVHLSVQRVSPRGFTSTTTASATVRMKNP
ncbi:MAG: hypothetical protein ACJA2W_001044 [Planctomycetota bacterium]